MADEDFGPVIDGMRDMTARLNAAFSKVEERDRETARALLGFLLTWKQRTREARDNAARLEVRGGAEKAPDLAALTDDLARADSERLKELVGAEVAAELEAIAGDLAAGPQGLLDTWKAAAAER